MSQLLSNYERSFLVHMFSITIFRRGHIVLKHSLPNKTEHVLFVRMTDIQRKLYSRFMEELITNRLAGGTVRVSEQLHHFNVQVCLQSSEGLCCLLQDLEPS